MLQSLARLSSDTPHGGSVSADLYSQGQCLLMSMHSGWQPGPASHPRRWADWHCLAFSCHLQPALHASVHCLSIVRNYDVPCMAAAVSPMHDLCTCDRAVSTFSCHAQLDLQDSRAPCPGCNMRPESALLLQQHGPCTACLLTRGGHGAQDCSLVQSS